MSLGLVLNPMVGVAPGTTTMQLGCGCTPAAGIQGLGACPPDYYPGGNPGMPVAITASPGTTEVEVYATESTLRGLGAPTFRWDVLAFAIGLGFAATLGYLGYSSRKQRRAQ